MAGDYKSYLIRTSMLLALCIIWTQHLWCMTLQDQQAQQRPVCNVLSSTHCILSNQSRPILPTDHIANVFNWSSNDRAQKQAQKQKMTNSFAIAHCQSRAVQPPWQKVGQKFACTGALFHNIDDDDGCRAMNDCDTTGKKELVQTSSESLPLHPLIPLPVLLWLFGMFEIFDLILTLQAQEDDAKQATRHSCSLFPLRTIRQLGIVFCLGLLMQSRLHVLSTEHFLPMQNSMQCNNSKTKQRRSKNSRHVLPDPYCSMFNTSTFVRIPDKQMKALSLHVIGDGNCMWRAIAKSNNIKWYRLKRQVIRYIADQHNPDHLDDFKRISRRNAWGNYSALAATASFFARTYESLQRRPSLTSALLAPRE